MITVELFTKPDCKLCEEAKEKLQSLKSELDFELKEINIRESDDLTERYGKLIPVILINGLHFANYTFEEANFRERLKRVE
ncbi:MAG: glutaredoxin family protein [Ignavibacteriae bacterium]|nr:MAG: glutaredoxin family protein [Ignavibacteriota bacterium]